jgi:hypothetical protein
MDGVEHRQLTAQGTHGAIVSNIFHCKRPRFTSTAYSAACERVIMIMPQNYFFGFAGGGLAVSVFERQQSSTLEPDPEKACPALDAGWAPVFPKRSCSNKKIERDDDSKKSHPALASRTLPTLLSTGPDLQPLRRGNASAHCPSRSGVIATSRKIVAVRRTIQTNR